MGSQLSFLHRNRLEQSLEIDMTHDEASLSTLSGAELLRVYNDLCQDHPVKSFKSKAQAIERILKAQDAIVNVLVTVTEVPAPKAEPTPRPSVAQRTKALLLAGLTDDEVWTMLCQEYQMITTKGYVSWYRRGMEFGFKKQAA